MLSTTKQQGPCDKNCSHYRTQIQDPTGQSQELCVEDKEKERSCTKINSSRISKCSINLWSH